MSAAAEAESPECNLLTWRWCIPHTTGTEMTRATATIPIHRSLAPRAEACGSQCVLSSGVASACSTAVVRGQCAFAVARGSWGAGIKHGS